MTFGPLFSCEGQGGNDGLGNKKQMADQVLERGNLALCGNIQLGIPVRVFRKNVDKAALYGSQIIYDGLYDVVRGSIVFFYPSTMVIVAHCLSSLRSEVLM